MTEKMVEIDLTMVLMTEKIFSTTKKILSMTEKIFGGWRTSSD